MRPSGAPRPLRRTLSLLGGAAAVVLALLCARMLLGARAELRAADEAGRRGDSLARSRHLRRAMAYYLPGSPLVRRAEQALRDEADAAEARGDRGRALEILHELRSAILSLRGLTRPLKESLPEINRRISQLSAAHPGAAVGLRDAAGAESMRRRLDRPPEPHPLWAGLGLLGLVLWAGGGLLLVLRGLRPDLGLVPSRFLPLLAVTVAGLLLFGVGLGLA